MRVQLDRGPHDLVVALVAPHDVDAHRDRLVGLVGDDDALADLRAAGAVLGGVIGLDRRRGLALLGRLGLLARAVTAPLGGVVLAALLALRGPLLGGARRTRRGAARAAALLELLAARLRGRSLSRRSLLRRGLGRLGRLGDCLASLVTAVGFADARVSCLFGGLSHCHSLQQWWSLGGRSRA